MNEPYAKLDFVLISIFVICSVLVIENLIEIIIYRYKIKHAKSLKIILRYERECLEAKINMLEFAAPIISMLIIKWICK